MSGFGDVLGLSVSECLLGSTPEDLCGWQLLDPWEWGGWEVGHKWVSAFETPHPMFTLAQAGAGS